MERKPGKKKSVRETIRDQIIAIRDSGETNMFDSSTVQSIAKREGYLELEWYIKKHRMSYLNFILTGEYDVASDK
jgi:hypothetical protein